MGFRLAGLIASLLLLANVSQGSVLVPTKSLRALGGRQVWVPICSRRGVNGSGAWYDNTDTAVMDQVACFAPSWGTVTAIRLVYAAFDMPQQGEVDRPVTATATASIYVPGANAEVLTANGGVAQGSTSLLFSSTALGANAISLGQIVSSTGGGIAPNTYVSAVTNTFLAGGGNIPGATTVTLSTATTAATAAGQPFSFAGEIVPAKFFGKRQFTIEPSHDVVTSDPVSVELAAGTEFYVRTSASFSAAGMQVMDYPGVGSRLAGEFDSRTTVLNDQTMVPTTLSNAGGGFWCPVAVLGLVTLSPGQMAPGGVLVLGDSIAAGTGDNPDALGFQGYVQRSLENNVPFITAARGSTTAWGLQAHGDGQYALAIDTGITDVLLEDGRNDVSSFNVSDAALENVIQSIVGRYVAAGKRVWCFTVPPTTQSNDGWLTLANQSWTVATNTTGASTTPSASPTIVMSSLANLAVGQAIFGVGIAPGTTITALSASLVKITLSVPTSAAIAPATKLSFGSTSASASPSEMFRRSYNGFLRRGAAQLGCTGLIDDDLVLADPAGSGKWRVDLGAASADGVHPAAVLHQALVTARLISPGMFVAQ